MGKSIIMHINEAPWILGQPSPPDGPWVEGSQLFGDLDTGPWVHISNLEANHVTPAHSHSQDEVIYIVAGEITMGNRACGPGTVIYVERDTAYGFTVGGEGVRFLNIRPGLATVTIGGKTVDPYRESISEGG